jgi:excisionase family DNA binding protein
LAELCELSGLSESTIRRRVKDGSLPAFQPGGHRKRLLFPVDVLDRVGSGPTTVVAERVIATDPSIPPQAAEPPAGTKPRWKSKLAQISKQKQR